MWQKNFFMEIDKFTYPCARRRGPVRRNPDIQQQSALINLIKGGLAYSCSIISAASGYQASVSNGFMAGRKQRGRLL